VKKGCLSGLKLFNRVFKTFSYKETRFIFIAVSDLFSATGLPHNLLRTPTPGAVKHQCMHIEEMGDRMSGDDVKERQLIVDHQSTVAIEFKQRFQEPGC
jgi:hypothetical protein